MYKKIPTFKSMSFIKKVVALCVLVSCGVLNAEWDPEFCLMDKDPSEFKVLDDQGFKELKKRVISALSNTWCTTEKANLLMDLVFLTRPEVCVEVGAFTGSSVLPVAAVLKHVNHGKVYAIDAWSNVEATRYLDNDDPNKPWWSSVDMNTVHKMFQQLKKSWSLETFCEEIHKPSNQAVNQVNNIDFLNIDGDFSEKGSLEDVRNYIPKVKSGGYILLSNLFVMIKDKQPKIKCFCELFDSCEMICEIERDNAVLFRKN